ncbi:inovirus Gp2 family protein [Yersinia mollaretii]|uniref:inovirus Gp2 family protein n=1 Tax=Yersinia mollaretii TaxID=33060 RepID=UPI0021BD19C9|nr:inovirus Gp2 family protein [Yersinia mollaretii]
MANVLLRKKGRSTLLHSGPYLHNSLSYKVYYGTSRKCSPLYIEILDKFTNEINAMRSCYSRTYAFRFDLHIPERMSVDESNSLISKLFSKLRDKFKSKQWDNQPIKKFAYGWVWEIKKAKKPHYHLWIALPGNQVQKTGHVDYGLFKIINDLWMNLTEGLGSAHLPKNSYMIKRDDDRELKEFVYRISYLAKDDGKYSQGDKTKRFDGSRLFGKLTPTNIEKQTA